MNSSESFVMEGLRKILVGILGAPKRGGPRRGPPKRFSNPRILEFLNSEPKIPAERSRPKSPAVKSSASEILDSPWEKSVFLVKAWNPGLHRKWAWNPGFHQVLPWVKTGSMGLVAARITGKTQGKSRKNPGLFLVKPWV